MCFRISRDFQSNPPEPLESEVKIVKSDERVVFVKEFGGFAMQDWVLIREAETFRSELGEKIEELELGWTPTRRRRRRRSPVRRSPRISAYFSSEVPRSSDQQLKQLYTS